LLLGPGRSERDESGDGADVQGPERQVHSHRAARLLPDSDSRRPLPAEQVLDVERRTPGKFPYDWSRKIPKFLIVHDSLGTMDYGHGDEKAVAIIGGSSRYQRLDINQLFLLFSI
jgi:hypothetical protein